MVLIEGVASPYYVFENIMGQAGVRHFVSTRLGGVSVGPYAGLNIGFGTDDAFDSVLRNREILAQSVGIPLGAFVALNQVHGINVAVVASEDRGKGAFDRESAVLQTDAAITNQPGVCLFVMGADCTPVLLFDPVKRVIGACHSGWRGTVKHIVREVVLRMVTTFGCNPSDMMAGVGPSIGSCCYEVGEEVAAEVLKSFGTTDGFMVEDKVRGGYSFDLWYAIKHQLLEVGIQNGSIEMAELCTRCNDTLFFSSRSGKGTTGRFGAGILMNS